MDKILQHYYLGGPVWANKKWVGKFFAQNTKAKDYLTQYAQVFNTIEGNHTFYGAPKEETVLKWRYETPAHFRFCFKFPKQISHTYKLMFVEEEMTQFFKTFAPLSEKIGLFFLQLPPKFNRSGLPTLKKFLSTLPKEFNYAVEVRHPDFYGNTEFEKRFNEILHYAKVNRAIFDTVTLHSFETDDKDILATQEKKPKMKECFTATAATPFLRFVGPPNVEPNIPRLDYIAKVVARWIKEGRTPFIFMHSPPDDFYAPHLCRRFHGLLQGHLKEAKIDIGTLPHWPCEKEQEAPKQMTLF